MFVLEDRFLIEQRSQTGVEYFDLAIQMQFENTDSMGDVIEGGYQLDALMSANAVIQVEQESNLVFRNPI